MLKYTNNGLSVFCGKALIATLDNASRASITTLALNELEKSNNVESVLPILAENSEYLYQVVSLMTTGYSIINGVRFSASFTSCGITIDVNILKFKVYNDFESVEKTVRSFFENYTNHQ